MSVARNVQEVYGYESASIVSSFSPQIFVDVTETFTLKMTSLRKFKSQLKSEFIDGMEGIAKYRALQARVPGRLYESFETYKIVKNEKSSNRLKILDLQSQIESLKNIISDFETKHKILNQSKVDNVVTKNMPVTKTPFKKRTAIG